ncbi:MAG: histidine kinase dimerization/phosphoacceptor domain -containing protein [Candidatus Aminicenantales bacterium]
MKTAVNCLYQNSEDREKFQKKMDRDGFVKDEELALRRKDGTGFLGEVCAVAIRDEKGHVRFYDGIVEDITERKRAEEKLRASLKEKEVLLREIHHRVKNNLQIISSLLNLQSRYIRDPSALEMFKESRDRVRSMALVHEKLYSSEDMANVDFSEYIQSLARHLCMAYGMNANGITVDVEARDVCLDINTSIPCGLIINELISNALKHAFRGRKRGKIRILLRQEQPDRYRMVVSDDGVGLPKDLDVQRVKSLGLQLVCMLVEQLQGEMTIKSGKGTSFEIAFRGLS